MGEVRDYDRVDVTGYAPRHPGEYGLSVLSAPASEPVSLALAKSHLRIDHAAEDALITAWVTAARELTETYTRKRWVTQQLRLTLERFPYLTRDIRLPVSPVATIDNFAYTDANGNAATLATDGSAFQKWLDHNPPLLCPLPYQPWPITKPGVLQAITIDFTAGTAAAGVPQQVTAAILLTLGDWDKNRAGEGDPIGRGLPNAAKFLLDSLWAGAYS